MLLVAAPANASLIVPSPLNVPGYGPDSPKGVIRGTRPNSWFGTQVAPDPPVTIFSELSKPGGEDAFRIERTFTEFVGRAPNLQVTPENAADYGVDWAAFRDAITDPEYTEFAIGWGDVRHLVNWLKPVSVFELTEWRLGLPRYVDNSNTEDWYEDWHLEVYAAIFGGAVYPNEPFEIPEPTSISLLLLCGLAGVICSDRHRC